MAIQLPKPIYEKHTQQVILFLHAYSGSSNDVRMLARFMERKGYSVYAPIFSGHGTMTPEDILASSPNNWWQETLGAYEFLKEEGFQEIYVFGLSMGGIFATLLLEENFPEIKGGGIFSSPIYPLKESKVPENFVLYSQTVLNLQKTTTAEKTKRLEKITRDVLPQLDEIKVYSNQAYLALSKIEVPYFIGQAGADEMIPATAILQTLQQLISANKALTFQWYPNSTHVLTTGKARNQLAEDVWHFLESSGGNEEKNGKIKNKNN